MNRRNKGFTLGELLIVVAIIAVLVAVSIPFFTDQLEKSRESVDLSNVRSAYSEVMVSALSEYAEEPVKTSGSTYYMNVSLVQKASGWTTDMSNVQIGEASENTGTPHWVGSPEPNGTCTVSYSKENGVVIDWTGSAPAYTEPSNGNQGSNSGSSNTEGTGGGNTGGQITPTVMYQNTTLSVLTYEQAWPQDFAPYEAKPLTPGSIFTYEGAYYVVAKETNVNASQTPDVVDAWYAVVKLNGKDAVVWADLQKHSDGQIDNAERGQVYKMNDGYWVYNDGGTWTQSPSEKPSAWYKIPY